MRTFLTRQIGVIFCGLFLSLPFYISKFQISLLSLPLWPPLLIVLCSTNSPRSSFNGLHLSNFSSPPTITHRTLVQKLHPLPYTPLIQISLPLTHRTLFDQIDPFTSPPPLIQFFLPFSLRSSKFPYTYPNFSPLQRQNFQLSPNPSSFPKLPSHTHTHTPWFHCVLNTISNGINLCVLNTMANGINVFTSRSHLYQSPVGVGCPRGPRAGGEEEITLF